MISRSIVMKKIVLTGGGTAGHVTPNIALIPRLKELGYEIHYVGSYDGIEKKLIEELGIPYHGISSGKLRRYFDLNNFIDPFRVIRGYFQSKKIMKTLKPNIVFSKGGFVSVPVTRAAAKKKVPVILHESDMTPGLANRLALKKANRICCNFPETIDNLPKGKAVVTGTPIRAELFSGDREAAKRFCGFTDDKPVVLFIGGSTGSQIINETLSACLDELLKDFNIIHICGDEKMDNLRYMISNLYIYNYQNKDNLNMNKSPLNQKPDESIFKDENYPKSYKDVYLSQVNNRKNYENNKVNNYKRIDNYNQKYIAIKHSNFLKNEVNYVIKIRKKMKH